jgi:hypothetical protein
MQITHTDIHTDSHILLRSDPPLILTWKTSAVGNNNYLVTRCLYLGLPLTCIVTAETTTAGHTPQHSPGPELIPEDEDEELAAYAEEFVRQAAEDDFGDIPEDVLFGWSDLEDFDESHDAKQKDDMDITH